jgi:hypothetical protein
MRSPPPSLRFPSLHATQLLPPHSLQLNSVAPSLPALPAVPHRTAASCFPQAPLCLYSPQIPRRAGVPACLPRGLPLHRHQGRGGVPGGVPARGRGRGRGGLWAVPVRTRVTVGVPHPYRGTRPACPYRRARALARCAQQLWAAMRCVGGGCVLVFLRGCDEVACCGLAAASWPFE